MSKYDLLVAGEINPDLILSAVDMRLQFGQVEQLVESASLTIGSSSVIFACGAARLGMEVAFLGIVGEDLFGRFMLDEMQQRGIDISPVLIDPNISTGISVIFTAGEDRAILTYAGAMSALAPEHISDGLMGQCRHVHIASYFIQTKLQPHIAGIFEHARSLGLSTSLDTNWDPSERWAGVGEALKHTSVFFPNRAETIALTGEGDIDKSLLLLSKQADVVAVKNGSEGGIAQRGEEKVKVPAPDVKVVDTVGAGDSFDAGFIYGYLQDWPLERCLRIAVTCGSLSTRAAGGTASQPGLAEALEEAGHLNAQQ